MNTSTANVDTSSTTTSPQQKKSVGDHAAHYWGKLTGMFDGKKKATASSTTTNPSLTGGRSRRRRRSRNRSRKGGNPKKGMASKSRKGRKDFVTHKGDKYYNRKGHRQSKNAKGKRKSPYRH